MVDPEITFDQIQLEPAQKMGMVRRLYYKTFPKEAPKHAVSENSAGNAVVSGQRGNLGAFHRSTSSVSSTPPRTAPKKAPEAEKGPDKGADGTEIVETTPTLPEAKPPALEQMKERLLSLTTVDDEAMRQLAVDRANAVREYLINIGEVPAERLSLAAITADQPATKGARVELRLK
jgi:hypothetical protein